MDEWNRNHEREEYSRAIFNAGVYRRLAYQELVARSATFYPAGLTATTTERHLGIPQMWCMRNNDNRKRGR